VSKSSLAPTVSAERAQPGEPMVEFEGPELPAATTTTTPAAVALSTAWEVGSSGSPEPPRLRLATSR